MSTGQARFDAFRGRFASGPAVALLPSRFPRAGFLLPNAPDVHNSTAQSRLATPSKGEDGHFHQQIGKRKRPTQRNRTNILATCQRNR